MSVLTVCPSVRLSVHIVDYAKRFNLSIIGFISNPVTLVFTARRVCIARTNNDYAVHGKMSVCPSVCLSVCPKVRHTPVFV